MILCSAVLVEHQLVTDRHRRTQGHKIFRASIASCGKNNFQLSLLCEVFAIVSSFKCLDTLYVHFYAMMLLVEWQEGHSACKKTGWWGTGMVICLEQGADLHTAQLMPLLSLSLPSVKSRLVLPFWYQLTWVVLEKWQQKTCVLVVEV